MHVDNVFKHYIYEKCAREKKNKTLVLHHQQLYSNSNTRSSNNIKNYDKNNKILPSTLSSENAFTYTHARSLSSVNKEIEHFYLAECGYVSVMDNMLLQLQLQQNKNIF